MSDCYFDHCIMQNFQNINPGGKVACIPDIYLLRKFHLSHFCILMIPHHHATSKPFKYAPKEYFKKYKTILVLTRNYVKLCARKTLFSIVPPLKRVYEEFCNTLLTT